MVQKITLANSPTKLTGKLTKYIDNITNSKYYWGIDATYVPKYIIIRYSMKKIL